MRVVPARSSPWSFTISDEPLTAAERSLFGQDLARLGAEPNVFRLLDGLLPVRSRKTRPQVLRGYRDGRISGAAWFFECRAPGSAFFDSHLARLVDLPRIPMFLWLRYGLLPDHLANPGLVVEKVARHDFTCQAVQALTRAYLYGSVIDYQDSPDPAPGPVRHQIFDNGHVSVPPGSTLEDFVRRGSQLRKKMNKFRNKGGRVRVVHGALPAQTVDTLRGFFATMSFQATVPYQDIYELLINRALTLEDEDMVHVIAEIDGEPVGYHSFFRSGSSLRCLSGGFDRTRRSTWHAYENLLLASIEYCIEHGLDEINCGPVLNESKKKLMNDFRPMELRTYVRYRRAGALLPWVYERSNLRKERYADFINIDQGALAGAGRGPARDRTS